MCEAGFCNGQGYGSPKSHPRSNGRYMWFWKEFTSPITSCGRLVLETSSDAHISKIARDVSKDCR